MKRSQVITLVLSTVIVACSFIHIFYSHRLSKLDGVDQLAIALSVFFIIKVRSRWNSIANGLVFVLLGGIALLLLNVLHNEYADQQLTRHGTKANAIVTSAEYMSGYKHYPGIIIKFSYTAGGKIYNKSIMDEIDVNRRFSVGDTIHIKYSSADPDLFEEVAN
ncbi:MAG: DUF3592 domain-containing protein [Bacteroidota bacterium]